MTTLITAAKKTNPVETDYACVQRWKIMGIAVFNFRKFS